MESEISSWYDFFVGMGYGVFLGAVLMGAIFAPRRR